MTDLEKIELSLRRLSNRYLKMSITESNDSYEQISTVLTQLADQIAEDEAERKRNQETLR